MTTVTKDIVIPSDRKITLELPANFPAGLATITVVAEPEHSRVQSREKSGIAGLRGKGKGKVWMADDFNAPLDDFAE